VYATVVASHADVMAKKRKWQRIDTLIDSHVWLWRQSLRKAAKRKRTRGKRQ
jgi:hypothetical protein